VLDDRERRRVLEQPTREYLAPGQRIAGLGALLGEDLHEGAFFLGLFPGQSPLAGGELDDDAADPLRFAGLQRDVLRQVVALVEQADHRDAVLDRRTVLAFDRRRACRPGGGDRLGNFGGLRFGIRGWLAAAASQRSGEKKGDRPLHRIQASGDQAS